MNAKKYLHKLKKISQIILLILGFIIGLLVMYLYDQPKLIFQEKVAKNMATLANKNKALAIQSQKEASASGLLLASASAEIKTLLSLPPKVEYRTQTQYVETPAQQEPTQAPYTWTTCNSDQIGGQNCTTYGGKNLKFTHCTSNGIGGMNCN